MIIGFRHKGLEQLYRTGSARGVQAVHARKLGMILQLLDVAQQPEDMGLPGLGLHPLKGGLVGHWSVSVNANWRVTFRFVGTDVELVDYQDYH
ncbi:MAG: type II toxin-antitoxin system RelE/ParE family toxin [Zoogloeaceae bacterium]|jgi:proteic killer suppression protein|nr:type II toxin-antitoxin system RelE/ParE family toxin [Zoogloeaceae bacterium]